VDYLDQIDCWLRLRPDHDELRCTGAFQAVGSRRRRSFARSAPAPGPLYGNHMVLATVAIPAGVSDAMSLPEPSGTFWRGCAELQRRGPPGDDRRLMDGGRDGRR
jgi:hypothetical protein